MCRHPDYFGDVIFGASEDGRIPISGLKTQTLGDDLKKEDPTWPGYRGAPLPRGNGAGRDAQPEGSSGDDFPSGGVA
ncbi:hypothetical protein C4577_02630 [Candidatus Parcubacteria bacterium]|nr:MAG: hypothetical protein C4577_02630 [Candidatus Parcubacteria bacterium]